MNQNKKKDFTAPAMLVSGIQEINTLNTSGDDWGIGEFSLRSITDWSVGEVDIE